MSKTLYAHGARGMVAVLEGDDISSVFAPWDESEKFYFHSQFIYLYKHAGGSATVTFPAVPAASGSTVVSSSEEMIVGTVEYDPEQIPVVFFTVNNSEIGGHMLVQKNSDKSFRFLYPKHYSSGGIMTLAVGEYTRTNNQTLTSFQATVSYKVYLGMINSSDTTNLLITPDQCILSKGKFNSEKTYAKINEGGFKYPMGDSIVLGDRTFTYLTPPYIEVKI